MKVLSLGFIVLALLGSFNINRANAQRSTVMDRSPAADWSALFPEIAGCERSIRPLSRTGEIFEQTAVYRRAGFKNAQNENYLPCGSIALRVMPGARKAAAENFKQLLPVPFRRKTMIGSFDAYSVSPLCGNDNRMGSLTVYFDADKALIVDAYRGAGSLWSFSRTADFEGLKKSMDELVENMSQQTNF
jgi:hypothetical protein